LRAAEASGHESFKAVTAVDYELVAEATWQTVAPANAFDDIDTPADRARTIGQ
jgi:hypothetical protein